MKGPDEGGVSDWSEWHSGFGRSIFNPTARNDGVRLVANRWSGLTESYGSSPMNSRALGFLIFQLRTLPI